MEQGESNAVAGSILSAGAGRIYNVAKASLEKHITLNPTVPNDVGCAEAVSFILKKAGYSLPIAGIAGTAQLWIWLHGNPQFRQVSVPTPGCVIISPTGSSSIGSAHGHTGIVGNAGILSNDSATGLFLEFWTLPKWQQYYHLQLGFPIYYYQAVN